MTGTDNCRALNLRVISYKMSTGRRQRAEEAGGGRGGADEKGERSQKEPSLREV